MNTLKLIIVLTLSIMYSNCSAQFKQLSKLSKDDKFQAIAARQNRFIGKSKTFNLDRVNGLMSKGENLSPTEFLELLKILGFNNYTEYVSQVKYQKNLYAQLNKEYDLSNISDEKITKVIVRSHKVKENISGVGNKFSSIYNTCEASAVINAAAENLGYETIDATDVLRLVCHDGRMFFF